MQTLIIEWSEFLNLVKTMCPKYQFYSCFFRINIRVRISEPCKIPILQTLLQMQTLIIEWSEFLNLSKPLCPKYQFYSCFFRINIRVRISELCKIPIRQNFAKNASLDNRGVRISESFKTSVSKISIYSCFFPDKYKGQNF